MKRETTLHLLTIVAVAVCIAASLPLLTGNYKIDNARESAKSEVPYNVSPPGVPDKINFAGENIELKRYDRRERMDRELMAFTYMHSTTMLTIKRANRFFPVIEPILKENGIPDDLKYLAIIESNLNPLARSSAGAAGMWQFMQKTGRDYGLEVNDNVDERYHIEKATHAACKYLKEAYDKYGDWLSVAASYNGGQARISSAMEKQLATNATDLWLVEETSRYMYRLLAAKAVFADPERYGFLLKREQLYPPIAYNEITVADTISNLARFAQDNGITYAQLKDFNPWLRDTFLQNKSKRTYTLKIPTREGMYYNPKKTVPYNKNWVID
ncbi:MAG: lytic transglycosylase domain-containing protein [Mediterranea sp.]|jgi:hypothetical protein|nr:lytic transglycosylase domain-containing protein [Mediterranea sp.]